MGGEDILKGVSEYFHKYTDAIRERYRGGHNIKSDDYNIESEHKSSDFFCYKGTMVFEQVLSYYRTNMERLGWSIKDLSNDKEGLLFCDKLNRTCVISVRDDGACKRSRNRIYLFVKNKIKKEEGVIKEINSKDINNINIFAENNFFKG